MKRRFLFGALMMVLVSTASVSNDAMAYTVESSMLPTDLTIEIKVKQQPIHNNFTRYLIFKNEDGLKEYVAVSFTKTSYLRYSGQVTADGLDALEDFVILGNRSYWDKMYFANSGGSTALNIDWMKIWIEYGGHSYPWEPDIMIGYAADKYLDSGDDSFYVSSSVGRRKFARNYFNWTLDEFKDLPSSLRHFIFDIGKSGSDDADKYGNNPKYGYYGSPLCSETVSWYYYEYGTPLYDPVASHWYTFRDVEGHNEIHNAFRYTGRLYCYHSGAQKWVLRNRDYSWKKNSAGKYITYHPQAGDYLDRRDHPNQGGHAMMMIEWNDTTKMATVIDGPYPISFREVPVHQLETVNGRDFCVGRIPENG